MSENQRQYAAPTVTKVRRPTVGDTIQVWLGNEGVLWKDTWAHKIVTRTFFDNGRGFRFIASDCIGDTPVAGADWNLDFASYGHTWRWPEDDPRITGGKNGVLERPAMPADLGVRR